MVQLRLFIRLEAMLGGEYLNYSSGQKSDVHAFAEGIEMPFM